MSQQHQQSTQHQQQQIPQTPITTLYHPSIFRYTCNGRLTLDSRTGGRSKLSAGVCRGVQSRLEHVEHWQLTTRDEAVQTFQARMMMLDEGGGGGAEGPPGADPDGSSNNNSGGGPRKKKDPPPTLSPAVDPSSGAAHAIQAVYLSNVLVYPPSGDRNVEEEEPEKEGEEDAGPKNRRRKGRHPPPSSSSALPQTESWRCYGSTEVDLLVLRPQHSKEESIAAVAPYCSPGSTVRDVSTPALGKERTTTIRLGIVEIIYQSLMGVDEDDEDGLGEAGKAQLDGRSDPRNAADQRAGLQPSGTANDGSGTKRPADERGAGRAGNADASAAPTASLPGRVYQSGTNIAKHMKLNGQILWESLQDEYPNRTYEAGQRIVAEFGKTTDRTLGLMKKVANYLVKGDWDDDSDGHGGPPKRK